MNPATARKSLDQKLSRLPSTGEFARPHRGWIKAIREAIGMTTAQLAKRMGVSQPRITELEQAEIEDKVTLASLRRAAEALDCTLIYAFVPRQSTLEESVMRRARIKAMNLLEHVHHTMALEDQSINDQSKDQIENLAQDLVSKKSRWLWDDNKT